MQMSVVMRRRFISSGDFDGALFWPRIGFVKVHAHPCACYRRPKCNINDPKCNKVLNVITIFPKCYKLLSCQLQ